MREYTQHDKIMNMSGLSETAILAGDVEEWSHPDEQYLPIIKVLSSPNLPCPEEALKVFINMVTIMKNKFYMDIAQRIAGLENITPSEESLRDFAINLNNQGFGKTVLLGPYKCRAFTGLVVKWCNDSGVLPLYPFSMTCDLEDFVERQLVLNYHTTIC